MFLAQIIPNVGDFVSDVVSEMIKALSRWIDELLKFIIDSIASILPSTPDSLRLSGLLEAFFGTGQVSFGQFYIYQAAVGISLILFAIVVYKVIKILPFT